jgi:hypothetical protein
MNLDAIIPASEKQPAPPPEHTAAAFLDLLLKTSVAGVTAFGEVREERAAESKKEEIRQKILKLDVADKLEKQLLPRLPSGWHLEKGRKAEHPYGKPDYMYTALWCDGAEFALVQLPQSIFATDENVLDFAKMLKAFRSKRTRLFAEGGDGIWLPFSAALDDENSRGTDWRFIPWPDVVALVRVKQEFWDAFKIPKPDRALSRAAVPRREVNENQLGQIKDVLARLALSDYPSSDQAFRTLVGDSGWPDGWKAARLTGWTNSAQTDAGTFVEYMRMKGTFPRGHDLAGRSVLGEFLRWLLEKKALGGEDTETIARIVADCGLVSDADLHEILKP